MAKKVLIGTVVIGATRYYAGSLLDEGAEAVTIAAVVAAGGQLLDEGDAVVDAAALTAQQRLRDGQWQDVDRVMLAAVSKSAYVAAQGGGGGAGPQRDFTLNGYSSDSNLLSIDEGTASQSAAGQWGEGLRNANVVFDAGWEGGDVVLTGTARGAPVEETFPSPGAGGGTVNGSKVFANVDLITNTAPSGTGTSAHVNVGRRFGTTRAPIYAVEKLAVGGDIATPAAVDLVEGWIELPDPYVQGTSVEILSVVA